jgi:uncharacterized protein (DUF1684 family)
MTAADAYTQEIQRWREGRVRRLLAPDGWLSLVDRIVLEEGDTELPIGTVTLRGGQARFRARAGVEVTCAGAPVADRMLAPDDDGAGSADLLVSGGRTYSVIHRGDIFAVRVKDPNAPARAGFRGIDYFPVDPRWRVAARFERYTPPRQTRHIYDIGPSAPRQVPGIARFTVDGRALTLEPVLEEDSNRLFFVFADVTSRSETYSAGRFLYAPVPAGEEVVLDFNTAFNPPCAFTEYATCPVTPAANRLPIAVRAGERAYAP